LSWEAIVASIALVVGLASGSLNWARTGGANEAITKESLTELKQEVKQKADLALVEAKLEAMQTSILADRQEQQAEGERINHIEEMLNTLLAYARRSR
jgi:coenzyme F420-reducing hydrogenase alpha subunit